MKVLFLGETILDVYHYGRVLGKPLKEPMLCFEEETKEIFTGGVHQAARIARAWADVDVESFVSITKERWVDKSHTRKLFEVYGRPVKLPAEPICYEDYDVVAVLDYGHGMFSRELIDEIEARSKYLAVNVQTNAGNYGFNLATKWNCDYLCVDETEARLATENQYGHIEDSLKALHGQFEKVVITLGAKGSLGTGGITVPAFTDRVVDTMGAGDAFFAVTALHAKDMPMEELLRLGNAAGAAKSQIVGHQTTITKESVLDYLG